MIEILYLLVRPIAFILFGLFGLCVVVLILIFAYIGWKATKAEWLEQHPKYKKINRDNTKKYDYTGAEQTGTIVITEKTDKDNT